MIPMRDGAKLYTVLIIPKGVRKAPIMLDRTPYEADEATGRGFGPIPENILSVAYAELVRAGYIVAVQDVRGKYRSEGDYVMNRPLSGPLNPTAVDHSTDAWDTIDWLVKNVPESNGRVGTIGTSYDGFTALMSLVNPHPALKASVPINPMVDVWKGDDWFHNGAFRQEMISYVYGQTADKEVRRGMVPRRPATIIRPSSRYGSAGAYGQAMGMEQLPFWVRLTQHPAYDEYWQDQAVDRDPRPRAAHRPDPVRRQRVGPGGHLRRPGASSPRPSPAPTPTSCSARGTTARPTAPRSRSARSTGARTPASGSARGHDPVPRPVSQGRPARRHRPGHRVRGRAPTSGSGSPTGRPPAPARCPANLTPLYLAPGRRVSFAAPAARASDSYVSDPARPVTYRARPNLSPWAPGLDLAHLARSTTSASPRPAPTSSPYSAAPLTGRSSSPAPRSSTSSPRPAAPTATGWSS